MTQDEIEGLAMRIAHFQRGIKFSALFDEILGFLLSLMAGTLDPVTVLNSQEQPPEPEAA